MSADHTLQVNNNHSSILDYYKNWRISTGGDINKKGTVTSNTTNNPSILTVTWDDGTTPTLTTSPGKNSGIFFSERIFFTLC